MSPSTPLRRPRPALPHLALTTLLVSLALASTGCSPRDPRLPRQSARPEPPLTRPVDLSASRHTDPCGTLALLAASDRAALTARGLSEPAVARIEAFRNGPDGLASTADDRFFKTSADLDALALDAADLAALSARAGVSCGRVPLQLLAFNDFHGALLPPSGKGGVIETPDGAVDAGGAEYVATWLARLHAESPNSLIVAAGDNVGATPLISAAFQDEPAIEALNHFGLALSSVGNHEFDEGLAELVRLQQGGCHPEKGCFGDTPFAGARFGYLAANVIVDETGQTAFPAYAIRRFGKVPVAFIGMTLEGTPGIVTPSGTAGLSFRDEVDTVNSLVPKLRAQGVEAIVVLIHEGGFATGHYSGCDGISGPIFDIVKGFDRAVDIVISGHTNAAHVCEIDGVLVTSAAHNGRLITDIDLELDERTHDIAKKTARNLIVTRDVDKDPRLTALIGKYQTLVNDVSRRVVGTIAGDIPRSMSESGEMPLGQLIADAQLFAEEDASAGGAEIAWINPGGVRADLLFAPTRDAAEGPLRPGEVTFGDLFTIQPFGNALITMTLTGAQIKEVLESQFGTPDAPRDTPKILQISHTLSYRIAASGPPGDRVRDITIKGRPLEPERGYRVVMNEFLATGGDGFAALKQGTERRVGVVDVDALEHYLKKHPGLAAPTPGRIRLDP